MPSPPKTPRDLLSADEKVVQEELSHYPLGRDTRRQKLINELMDQPELVEALADFAKLRTEKKDPDEKFLAASPPRVQAKPKRRADGGESRVLVTPRDESLEKAKAKYRTILKRLPVWMEKLGNSQDRHRFALKCFSIIYQGGLWLECVDLVKHSWQCEESFGLPSNWPKEREDQSGLVQVLGASPFARAALETRRIITAPREFLPEIFESIHPVHFFLIEPPTLEKRSVFCFFGMSVYGELEQFVLRSTLHAFQQPY
jgi:hypothetical protein